MGPDAKIIQNLFTNVAHGYDQANDAMTFGMARLWRKQLVKWSEAQTGNAVLDCATGTGDLALEFKRAVGQHGLVTGTDFCQAMLDRGPEKARKLRLDVNFQWADVLALPFADNAFDVASIAYGIRNVSDPAKALSELARVVRPGGRVMILETGDAPTKGLGPFLQFYVRQVVPRVGGWITGQRAAYEYLNNSSREFPSRERFLNLMSDSGAFSKCEYRVLMFGASFLYKGVVAR